MYTIDSFTLTKIGEGTHHIYEAKNNTNQLEVYAVKRYPIGEDKRDVFYREAKALMRLKHENVVKLCGVATDLNTSDLYLFMPFYKIGTLQTWWKDPTSVPKDKFFSLFCRIVHGCLEGLFHIHQNGIIHCDIKPSNIMINDEETPVIVDFDISVVNEDRGKTTVATARRGSQGGRGTWGYIAPELLEDRLSKSASARSSQRRSSLPPRSRKLIATNVRPSFACDMYSFGVTVFWMLFGDMIHNDDIFSSRDTLLPNFSSLFPHQFCNEVKNLVMNMTDEDPLARPTTTEALNSKFLSESSGNFGEDRRRRDHEHAVPFYWEKALHLASSTFTVDVTSKLRNWVHKIMHETTIWSNAGEGNDCVEAEQFNDYEVVKVEQVENPTLYWGFAAQRYAIMKLHGGKCPQFSTSLPLPTRVADKDMTLHYPHQDSVHAVESGEHLLFHGTSKEVIRKIVETGFDNRFNERGLFGIGAYFAENANKADEYTKADENGCRFMVLGRVLVGNPGFVKQPCVGVRVPPTVGGGNDLRFDSVIALADADDESVFLNKHREFIVYERQRSYPELIITYKRK
eukprot:m.30887 g.30887  ORF g.30887 m.30887 type:complete len:571 (+) comp6259_c0_seq5:546-2258(+)